MTTAFDCEGYAFRREPERRKPAAAVTHFAVDGYRFQAEPERPCCTIAHDGSVFLSNLAWRLLGQPSMAAFFHDHRRRAMAIVAAAPGTPGALTCQTGPKPGGRVRLHARRFLQVHDLGACTGKRYDFQVFHHQSLGPVLVAQLDAPAGPCRPYVRRRRAVWERWTGRRPGTATIDSCKEGS